MKSEIIYDKRNNVKMLISDQSVLFIFLPTRNNQKYECAEIYKDKDFSIDDLFELWKEKNYPLHMLDLINVVSLNLYSSEFEYALNNLPCSVADQSDVNRQFAIYQSARLGNENVPYKEMKSIAKNFKKHVYDTNILKSDLATDALKIALPSIMLRNTNYYVYLRTNKKNFAVVNHLPEEVLQFIDSQPFKYLHSTYFETNIQNEVALEEALNEEFYGDGK